MTDTTTLREKIAHAMWLRQAQRAAPNIAKQRTPEAFAEASEQMRREWLGYADAAITVLDAHQPVPDAVTEADAFDAFAQWFRKNYPGPDTIIHKPDWHSQRIFRAVKHAMKGTRP